MNTKHKEDCTRVFKNYDLSCDRCKELAGGSKPREGWQKAYYANKANNDSIRSEAIRNHNCTESRCNVICTAFDY